MLLDIDNPSHLGSDVFTDGDRRSAPRGVDEREKEKEMDKQILSEIEETEQLAHLSATHSNALVENPFE